MDGQNIWLLSSDFLPKIWAFFFKPFLLYLQYLSKYALQRCVCISWQTCAAVSCLLFNQPFCAPETQTHTLFFFFYTQKSFIIKNIIRAFTVSYKKWISCWRPLQKMKKYIHFWFMLQMAKREGGQRVCSGKPWLPPRPHSISPVDLSHATQSHVHAQEVHIVQLWAKLGN